MFDQVEQLYVNEPPQIVLSNKPYLSGSEHPNFPALLKYAGKDNMDVLKLNHNKINFRSKSSHVQLEHIAEEVKHIVNERLVKQGTILFRNLSYHVPNIFAFSKLLEGLGERMPYTAGMATRNELENCPGVMNASDDPEECTIEPHLEMSYRQEMPGK